MTKSPRKSPDHMDPTAEGKRGKLTRVVEMDNPFFQREHRESSTNPKAIPVEINIAESAIETLFARAKIDRAQKAAADRFRSIWEKMGGKGAGAIDYSAVRVDGGKNPEPISVKQLEAGRELEFIRTKLVLAHGVYAYRLVTYICGQGHNIHDLTETRRQRDTMTDNLRMYLDLMAEEWGFKKRAAKR